MSRSIFCLSLLTLSLATCAWAAASKQPAPATAPESHTSPLSARPAALGPLPSPAPIQADCTVTYDFSPRARLADASTSVTRAMVVEEFTATWCGWCYGPGIAIHRIEEEAPSDMIAIVYQIDNEYLTDYDRTQMGAYGVATIPQVWINGKNHLADIGHLSSEGEEGIAAAMQDIGAGLESERQRTAGVAPYAITIIGELKNPNPVFDIKFSTPTGFPYLMTAAVLVLEDKIPVDPDAGNGQTEINNVVRGLLSIKSVQLTQPGSVNFHISNITTLPSHNNANLKPAVIIYKTSSREIMAGKTGFDAAFNQVASSWSLYQ